MALFDFTRGFSFFLLDTIFFYLTAVQLLITVAVITYCFIHCFLTKSGREVLKIMFLIFKSNNNNNNNNNNNPVGTILPQRIVV